MTKTTQDQRPIDPARRLPDSVKTERLVLRRWELSDWPLLAKAVTGSIEHLRPWMPWIALEPVSPADRRAFIRDRQKEWEVGGDVFVGVFRDGRVVGSTGLHRRQGPGILEVGYWLHADHVRQGYATELTAALTSVAFTMPGIDSVQIHADKANGPSNAVPHRLGFTLVSEAKKEILAPGESGVDCAWSMSRSEWLKVK